MISAKMRRPRIKRLNLRATDFQERLIRTGAELEGSSVTNFILESACKQAEQKLEDQRHFVLSQKQWQTFTALLDRPIHSKPHLHRLLSTPSILEQR